MIANEEFLQDRFDRFNACCFGGELPPVPLRLSHSRTLLGQCCYKKKRGFWGRTAAYDFSIRISCCFDLPESELEDVLIHEMIHYYIGIQGWKDRSAHGPLFRKKMEEINQAWGRHIRISHRSRSEEQVPDAHIRERIVARVRLRDGRIGVKVLPHNTTSIERYRRGLLRSGQVEQIQLYLSRHSLFQTLPSSAALRIYFIDPERISEALQDAVPLRESK